MRRRTTPHMPVQPPANAGEGAERIMAAMVKLFDRRNGSGADWPLLHESAFRAFFRLYDQHTNSDEKALRLMQRVHEAAELRLTGGFADGEGVGGPENRGSAPAPSSSPDTRSAPEIRPRR